MHIIAYSNRLNYTYRVKLLFWNKNTSESQRSDTLPVSIEKKTPGRHPSSEQAREMAYASHQAYWANTLEKALLQDLISQQYPLLNTLMTGNPAIEKFLLKHPDLITWIGEFLQARVNHR